MPVHNTLFGHGPDLKKNRHLLCCEFTGYACRSIEEQYKSQNPDFTAMHHNGFYGNAGPIYEDKYYAPSLDKLKEAGAALGREVIEIADGAAIDEELFEGNVASLREATSLPVKADKGFAQYFGDYDPMPLNIHTGAVGEFSYAGVNYEAFATLGAHIRAEAPYKLFLPAANTAGWSGYIPTKETFEQHEKELEVECQDVKTPLTKEADALFCKAVGDTLCRMKKVMPTRYDATLKAVAMADGAEYSFSFAEPVLIDKLVLYFGQTVRTSCASDFTLCAYDEEGKLIGECSETNFSSGWYGFFVSGTVSSVTLIARKRYPNTTDGLNELTPVLYGLKFDPIKE